MSRLYSLTVVTKNADTAKVAEYFNTVWNEEGSYGSEDCFTIYGENNLCGGEGEEEAHERIAEGIRAFAPKALVKTRWTYLEDLPFEEYGDDFDE